MCRSNLEAAGWALLCSAWCANAEVEVFEKANGLFMTYALVADGQALGTPGRYLSVPDVADMESAMVEAGLMRARPEGFQHEYAANIDGENPFEANFLHPALRDRAVLEFFLANPEVSPSSSDITYFEVEPDGHQHGEICPAAETVEDLLRKFQQQLLAQGRGGADGSVSPIGRDAAIAA